MRPRAFRHYHRLIMSPERWRLMEELYHSARELGPAVLDGSDPDVRRSVEKLLAQDSESAILDRPATELLSDLSMSIAQEPRAARRPDCLALPSCREIGRRWHGRSL